MPNKGAQYSTDVVRVRRQELERHRHAARDAGLGPSQEPYPTRSK